MQKTVTGAETDDRHLGARNSTLARYHRRKVKQVRGPPLPGDQLLVYVPRRLRRGQIL